MQGKQTFVVGRTERKGTTCVVLRVARSPIAGPFTLKAVISKN